MKPHGALYNRMAVDPDVAGAVVDALGARCPVLVAPPAGAAVGAGPRPPGSGSCAEGFCDRGYDRRRTARRPRPRRARWSTTPAAAGAQARSLAVDGGVTPVDGTWVALEVETLCVHGDHPGADRRARAVRGALPTAGVTVRSFVDPTGG